jgi:hypothetical protein
MDDIVARIEAMFRRYAAGLNQNQADGVQLAKKFRKDMDSLIAQYGTRVIDAALDKVPIGEVWPSAALH